jgi:hypothetical protein
MLAKARNMFNHIITSDDIFGTVYNQYILPEIKRRIREKTLAQDFKFWDCLIKILQNGNPIILFDNDCGWKFDSVTADVLPFFRGDIISPVAYGKIERVALPTIEGKRVAFIFVFWNASGDGMQFDILTDDTPSVEDAELGGIIAWLIRKREFDLTIQQANQYKDKLSQIGLWICPVLTPFPMLNILHCLEAQRPQDAIRELIVACNEEFITRRVNTWSLSNAFNARYPLLVEMIDAHTNKKYHSSIYGLIPQIEGVITDWLYEVKPHGTVNWKINSKVKQFKQEVDSISSLSDSFRDILYSVTEFLVDGTPLAIFENWLKRIDPTFPNRHVVVHGQYDHRVFCEENSIKLFLLLDTICEFILLHRSFNNLKI